MDVYAPVLVVEDDENDIFLFQRAAREAAIQNPLVIARDGQEAIEYLSGQAQFAPGDRHPLPCLIVLDIKMPRKTGLDVLEWLAGEPKLKILPVIMFSSSPRQDDVARAYQLGANAFIVKPSSLQQRNELARLIKGFWLGFNQRPVFEPELSAP